MAEICFEALPQDLKRAILSRLPLKSLGNCICVSKELSYIIPKNDFNNIYLPRSTTRPRMLFMVRSLRNFHPGLPNGSAKGDLLCHSVYQEEKSLLWSRSSPQESHFFPLFEDLEYSISRPIRGLVCIRAKTKVMIWNPTIKKVETLPEMKTPKEVIISNYFGYDEVKKVFKVLCITKMESWEHQVFTVGVDKESWRQITCKNDHIHFPVTEGFCKGGVLYYGAKSNSKKSLVMSFNVESEEFDIIALPEEIYIDGHWNFVNYNGKIALVNDNDNDLRTKGVLQMWVKDETEGKWEKANPIVISGWNETHIGFYFKGTIGTGELVFARDFLVRRQHPSSEKGSICVLYYDTITQTFRRFMVGKEFYGYYVQTFLDHVDSLGLCKEQELLVL